MWTRYLSIIGLHNDAVSSSSNCVALYDGMINEYWVGKDMVEAVA
jgi:hypothetical protein